MERAFPLGIDNFVKLIDENYYYIDKTEFIRDFLGNQSEITLITRPRRFGKTLLMSMLKDFFDISRNSKKRFSGLTINKDKVLCSTWMNQYPVISFSLKSVEGISFDTALERLKILIGELCRMYSFLKTSSLVDEKDKADFEQLCAETTDVTNSLYLLMRMLWMHYGKPVILLIDECDVPLAKAHDAGYYREMMDVLRAMLGKVLIGNEYLKFAVLTGCLQTAKESILTDVNNLVTDTILDNRYDKYFGFTQKEINGLLADIHMNSHAAEMKFWYDGYCFGNVDIYCPWNVLNHADALCRDEHAEPKSYWENTSHNGIIRQFIDRNDLRELKHLNADFEALLAGKGIEKAIIENPTYDTMHSTAENLWSLLLFTGYLTRDNGQNGVLRIPNEEIRQLFCAIVHDWFKDKIKSESRTELFHAFWTQNAEACSKQLSEILYDTINCFENEGDFYRTFLVDVLSYAGYRVVANKRHCEDSPDVMLLDDRKARAIIIEMDWTDNLLEMDAKCKEVLGQIENKYYVASLADEYDEIICCGICFFKKCCKIVFYESSY